MKQRKVIMPNIDPFSRANMHYIVPFMQLEYFTFILKDATFSKQSNNKISESFNLVSTRF